MQRAGAILAILGLTVLSGCMASFSEIPTVPAYAGPTEPLPVRVRASGKDFVHIPPDQWMETPISSSLADAAARAVLRSGWVQASASSSTPAELGVYVAHYQGPGPALLPTLTAFLIPDVVDHRIDLKVRLTRPGYVARECSRSTGTRTWYQTLLVFAYPFRPPAYRRSKAAEALALACVAEVLQQDPMAPTARTAPYQARRRAAAGGEPAPSAGGTATGDWGSELAHRQAPE